MCYKCNSNNWKEKKIFNIYNTVITQQLGSVKSCAVTLIDVFRKLISRTRPPPLPPPEATFWKQTRSWLLNCPRCVPPPPVWSTHACANTRISRPQFDRSRAVFVASPSRSKVAMPRSKHAWLRRQTAWIASTHRDSPGRTDAPLSSSASSLFTHSHFQIHPFSNFPIVVIFYFRYFYKSSNLSVIDF